MTIEHIRYVVEIKQVYQVTQTVPEQFCTKETPTTIEDSRQYHSGEKLVAKEYDVRDVTKRELKERQVYRQEIDALNLVGVIDAVNSNK